MTPNLAHYVGYRFSCSRVIARALFVCALGALTVGHASADTARVAVAANFTAVAEELAERFEEQSGHKVMLSAGATGQLYAQISQGAPFDAFLSADVARVDKAVDEGMAVDGSAFVYALGQLALYAPGDEVSADTLKGDFQKLAIADPQAAPYGKAALEALDALDLTETVASRLVRGESIAQAMHFVESGNAELGFVALSQVQDKPGVWIVPADLYEPIEQSAVLLKRGEANTAAIGFLAFLRSDMGVVVIEQAGYAVP